MNEFEEYVKWKLSIKLNLIVSNGEKSIGIISEKIVYRLSKMVYGHGIYEIIVDSTQFPLNIKKLSECHYIDKNKTTIVEFNLSELRNRKLKKMGI